MRKLKKIAFFSFFMMVMISALFADDDDKAKPLESENDYMAGNGYVADIRIVMKESDWLDLQSNALDKEYFRADFWYDNKPYKNVAVRTKGGNSLISSMADGRLPLKIDFNFFNVAQEFQGIKKISLNNSFKDPSFMREILGYWLFEQMDIPTPRNAFADVWVNDTHLGLYIMVEQIDKTFLRRNFINSSGDLYKPEGRAGTLNWTKEDLSGQSTEPMRASENIQKVNSNLNVGGSKFGELVKVLKREGFAGSQSILPEANESSLTNQTLSSQGQTEDKILISDLDLLEQMAIKTNENKTSHKSLYEFLKILNQSNNNESFPKKIEKVLNVDQVLRYFAVSALIVHMDNYIGSGQNYYLYEENGKFTLIPWDLNEAFGGYDMETYKNVANFDIDSLGIIAGRPLASKLLAHKPYLEKYHQYIEQLLEGPFAESAIEAKIDRIAYFIKPYVEGDELKFFSDSEFERSIGWNSDRKLTDTGRQFLMQQGQVELEEKADDNITGMQIPPLRDFIRQRRLLVRNQLDG